MRAPVTDQAPLSACSPLSAPSQLSAPCPGPCAWPDTGCCRVLVGARIALVLCRQSGAKVSIREHDSDPTQKTVDMEGSLEQIEYATRLVRQFLAEKVAAMQANQMGPPGTHMLQAQQSAQDGRSGQWGSWQAGEKGSCCGAPGRMALCIQPGWLGRWRTELRRMLLLGAPVAVLDMERWRLRSCGGAGSRGGRLGSHNYKTRMCDNFMKGACNFGPRCHFAHGHQELREAQAAAGGPPAPGGM